MKFWFQEYKFEFFSFYFEQVETAEKFTRDDIKGITIATSIYFLQGIPLGLFGAFFLILKDYGVDYEQMAVLSMAIYPFSFKLLWSCIPDSIWIPKIGQGSAF